MSSDKKTLTYNTPLRKYRVRDKSSKDHDDLRQGIFDQLFLKSEWEMTHRKYVVKWTWINNLNMKIYLNYILRFSSYLVVNKVSLANENQSINVV